MGVQERFDLWRVRNERQKYLGPMPLCARSETMLIAMRALKDQAAAAYDLSEKKDCERRLYKILELYQAQQ